MSEDPFLFDWPVDQQGYEIVHHEGHGGAGTLLAGAAPHGETYSKRHRNTSAELKAQVRAEYRQQRCGEIDHRLPLALGGADELGNLWCQPAAPVPWTYKAKDRLEAYVWRAVCKSRTLTLQEGQAVFLAPDWRIEYRKVFGE